MTDAELDAIERDCGATHVLEVIAEVRRLKAREEKLREALRDLIKWDDSKEIAEWNALATTMMIRTGRSIGSHAWSVWCSEIWGRARALLAEGTK